MPLIRLDKFLASSGAGTRSEVKKLLRDGAVTVGGQTVRKPEFKIDPNQETVVCRGQAVLWQPFLCLMFYKPAGCVTATQDRRQKTVMDYITHERRKELFPAGRLDLDTEGLLFLMNDGALAHRMLAPGRHVEKTYFVRTEGRITQEDAAAFAAGVDIGEKALTMPARLTILESGAYSEAELTICEGKYHQVKRMFAARGKQVVYLKRTAMAGLALDEGLGAGGWRELTPEETERLRASC